MKPINDNIIGIFFHGFAHMFQAWNPVDPATSNLSFLDQPEMNDPAQLAKNAVILLLFYSAFMYAVFLTTPHICFGQDYAKTLFAIFTLTFALVHFIVPYKFTFTYVNTAITLSFIVSQMLREKDEYYTMQAWIFLATNIAPWMEALACTNFLVHYGGHFWFDMSIPLCSFAYYFILRSSVDSKGNLISSASPSKIGVKDKDL